MSKKTKITTLSIAAGTAFIASLAMGNVANAAQGANPFAVNELSGGYMQLAGAGHDHESEEKKMKKMKKEGKCGEGKCGGAKKKMKKEGSCGGDKKAKKEGSCGGDKKNMKEGSCGGKK